MVKHLFPRFLEDSAEYALAERWWQDLWTQRILPCAQGSWEPWLCTTFADGTAFANGNPIFSMWNRAAMRGLSIIQHEPTSDQKSLSAWVRLFGSDDEDTAIEQLVIVCGLLSDVVDDIVKLLLKWVDPLTSKADMNHYVASVIQNR